MSTHNTCKHLPVCEYHKGVGDCPEDCNRYRHKDETHVVYCAECRKQGNEDECPLLAFADYTEDDDYCSFGERKNDDAQIR